MSTREPYEPPAAPRMISTVDTAQGTPSGQYGDGDGYSSVAPG